MSVKTVEVDDLCDQRMASAPVRTLVNLLNMMNQGRCYQCHGPVRVVKQTLDRAKYRNALVERVTQHCACDKCGPLSRLRTGVRRVE